MGELPEIGRLYSRRRSDAAPVYSVREIVRLRAENEELRGALFECARLAGGEFDRDGSAPRPLAGWVVECVAQLRNDLDGLRGPGRP